MDIEINEPYRYKELPFQSPILSELALKLFTGRIVESKTVYDETLNYHIVNGGKKPNAKNSRDIIHKGFNALRKKGLAESSMTGFWKIGETSNELPREENIDYELNTVIVNQDILIVEKEKIADIEIGTGKSAVYLYYLPLYRQIAEQKDQTFWQCKIGRTDGDPLQRILSQAATDLPEKPHVAIIIRTDFSFELENIIHDVLTIRGKKIDNSPGAEWFLTSPDEVLSIYDFIQRKKETGSAD